MASARTVDPGVYEAYLQGRYWAGKFSPEDLLKAKGYFERAVALDPAFAPAWSGLAETLSWLGRFHLDTEPTLSEAEAAARRALQIDENQAGAHAVLSGVAQSRWRWQEAEEHTRRAIQLDPSSASAHRSYWRLLAPLGRFEEARREIELANRLDPLSAQMASNLGIQLLFEKRYEEAERGQELAKYLEAVGLAEAVPGFERELAASGYQAALRSVALRLSEAHAGETAQVGVICGLLAEAGELDEALRWLRLGIEQRAWEMPWLAIVPDLENLHGHPEYERILAELGLARRSS